MLAVFARSFLIGLTVATAACGTTLESGPPPLASSACEPEQVQVMVLGTFHMEQVESDIMSPPRQQELDQLIDALAAFNPDRVTVEFAYARNDEINEGYQRYLQIPADSLSWEDEIGQIGFKLARRLGHDSVYGVDVPMDLWNDSIRYFDDQYPNARGKLRGQWDVEYPRTRYTRQPATDATYPLVDLLHPWNTEAPPSLPEFGRFMPLVEGDIYAGALKLRPWFDRNLRIVQNFFRVLDPAEDQRLFMVVGGSHVRVLREIVNLTPQLCAVSPLPYLGASAGT